VRSLPAAIKNGFDNHYKSFWLVKLEASGSNTYYWTTASKNFSGAALILKETTGAALSYDSTMIAKKINDGEVDGIGPLESGIDIYEGGGMGSVSDVSIQILNQARFDQTILNGQIDIENRPITIYFGFIPPSPTVSIQNDMIQKWTGVVENVNEFDYGEYKLDCIDSALRRHKNIPTHLIETETFPQAPKDNIGKPIPATYGTFYANIETETDFETISPAPCICTNQLTGEFYADMRTHTAVSSVFHYNSGMNLFGEAITNPTITNYELVRFYLKKNLTDQFIVRYRKIMTPFYHDADDHAELINPFDSSATTYATMKDVATYKILRASLNTSEPSGWSCDNGASFGPGNLCRYRTYVGTIADYEADKIWIGRANRDDSAWAPGPLGVFQAADASAINILTDVIADTVTSLEWWGMVGRITNIFVTAGTAMQLQVKHVVCEVYALIGDPVTPPDRTNHSDAKKIISFLGGSMAGDLYGSIFE
jgi:hypothetical protein